MGQQLGDVGGLLLGGVLVSLLLERLRDDFLLPLGDLRGLIPLATATAASSTTAGLLRLRKLALKRVGLDEHHVGAGFGVGVLSGGVDADQIARNQFEIFEREGGGAVGLLYAFLREQIDDGFGAAVDGIMQRGAREAVIARGFGGHGDLFNGAGVVIGAGAHQRNLGRVGFAGLDEKIFADADGLALGDAGHVVDAVLVHFDGGAIDVIQAAGELNGLSVVEQDLAALEGTVGGNFKFGHRAGDGAQIAAALLGFGGHAGPGRVTVGDANLLHGGQFGDANVEALGSQRAGGNIVFDVLRQIGEQELIAACETAGRFGQHDSLFPLGRALKAGIQLDGGRSQAGGERGNQLVGVAAHDGVAGSHAQVVEGGLAAVRTGPKQRGAVAEKTGSGGDQP